MHISDMPPSFSGCCEDYTHLTLRAVGKTSETLEKGFEDSKTIDL